MKIRILTIATAGLLAMTSFGNLKAEDAAAKKPFSGQGEVLDLACYMDHGAKGAKHQECALQCIKGGSPMGLLTKDGSVYLLVEDHASSKGYDAAKGLAGGQAMVTGALIQRGGLPAIEVQSAVAVKS